MARRHRPRHRTVGRLLLRLLVGGGLIAALWATLGARSLVARIERDRLLGDLRSDAQTLSEEFASRAAEADNGLFAHRAAELGLTEAALLAPDGEGDYRCALASNPDWLGKKLWALTMEQPAGWERMVRGAPGQVVEDSAEDALKIALRTEQGPVLTAGISAEPIRAAVRQATYSSLIRFISITVVIGILVWALLWWRVALPLGRLAEAAAALATRRSAERIPLGGPDEIANLGAALNGLASEVEAERRRAEGESARWRALFDEIPAAAFIFAANGRVLDANREAQTLTGQTLDALQQRQRQDLMGAEGTLRLGDGSPMPVHWVHTRMDHEGRPATLSVALDLRQVQSAEARTTRMARVLDTLDVVVVELDPAGRVAGVNAEAARRLGQSVERLRGQPLTEIIDGEPALPPWEEIAEAVRSEGQWCASLRRRRGNTLCDECAVRIVPIRGGSGFVATVRDVTETARLARELARAERLESLGSLAGSVCRNLQESLRGIVTYTGHLRSICGDDSTEAVGLASIDSSAQRATQLMSHFVEFARDSLLHSEPTEINRVVQEVAAESQILEAPGISVSLDVEADLPDVSTDATILREALREILRSSLDALPAGGAVAIATRRGEDVHRVNIEIHHSGEVPDAATLHQATESLLAPDGDRAGLGLVRAAGLLHFLGADIEISSQKGAGTTVILALPVAPEAEEAPVEEVEEEFEEIEGGAPPPQIELLGREETEEAVDELIASGAEEDFEEGAEEDEEGGRGEESAPQQLTFAETGEDEEIEENEEVFPEEKIVEAAREPAAAAGTESPALLLVDDEQVVLDLVRDIFEDEPFDVVVARSGDEALDALQREGDRIFLAIVDLSMPAMDGWHVAEAMARDRPGLSIHIAAGYDTREEDIPSWARECVSGLVKKPFRAGALRDLIERELIR
jgi:PAS domain S-box-containing protein